MTIMFPAVDFYGKNVSAEEKLPVKTDKDTLREGYRYDPLLALLESVGVSSSTVSGFDVLSVCRS